MCARVKNIFTKLLKDVEIEVPKKYRQSAACMQTKAGDDSICNKFNHNMCNPISLHL